MYLVRAPLVWESEYTYEKKRTVSLCVSGSSAYGPGSG